MIINNEYIQERIKFWINSKRPEKGKESWLSKLKMFAPECLRGLIEWHFYPLIAGIRRNKRSRKEIILPHNTLAVNFITYCLENEILFDTSRYFNAKDDENIVQHIDNRIKSVLAGFEYEPKTLVQKQDVAEQKKIQRKVRYAGYEFSKIKIQGKTYRLPLKRVDYTSNNFIYHYGLKKMTKEVKDFIANKVFLDIGAFMGDTSLGFLHYHPSCIYAYEPVSETFEKLCKTLKENHTDEAMIIPLNKGLGEKEDVMTINIDYGASSLLSELSKIGINTQKIEISTIDKECADKQIGLIKMDVEGFEYYVIKGGLNTIRRDRPLLLISIYHTGKDFFEIPPLIQNYCPSYRFRYYDTMPSSPITEKIIIGYDSEQLTIPELFIDAIIE
jgi:FkbM family methyltransferase